MAETFILGKIALKVALNKVPKYEKLCFDNQHTSYNLHLIFLAS
jgi:hypothetical protein